MGEYCESKGHIVITSPAIARLMKSYKHYVMDCITAVEPIMDINTYYNRMITLKEMNKSRIYEKYRKELSMKELNGETDND